MLSLYTAASGSLRQTHHKSSRGVIPVLCDIAKRISKKRMVDGKASSFWCLCFTEFEMHMSNAHPNPTTIQQLCNNNAQPRDLFRLSKIGGVLASERVPADTWISCLWGLARCRVGSPNGLVEDKLLHFYSGVAHDCGTEPFVNSFSLFHVVEKHLIRMIGQTAFGPCLLGLICTTV